MKHRPALPDDSVNVSRTHPLREAAWLTGALVLIGALLFFFTGFGVDFVATRLPETTGKSLRPQIAASLAQEFGDPLTDERSERVQLLFNELTELSGRNSSDYQLLVLDNELVNALAAPGGLVVVFSGLLDYVESENELAMVLSHELGHIANRDNLRMLGRGLVTSGLMALVFGNANALDAQLLSTPNRLLGLRHSRERELAADRVGLDIVCQRYGHAGGATDFFARQADSSPTAFLATHPSSPDRVARIEKLKQETDCGDGETTLLFW